MRIPLLQVQWMKGDRLARDRADGDAVRHQPARRASGQHEPVLAKCSAGSAEVEVRAMVPANDRLHEVHGRGAPRDKLAVRRSHQ